MSKARAFIEQRIGQDASAIVDLIQNIEALETEIAELKKNQRKPRVKVAEPAPAPAAASVPRPRRR